MRPGDNCGKDYDPKSQTCRKCSSPNTHHEYKCFKYKRYNPEVCSSCRQYHHFAEDCKETSKFPPKANGKN